MLGRGDGRAASRADIASCDITQFERQVMNRYTSSLRRIFTIVALACWSASVAAEDLKPYKYAKVFKGSEGEIITIVPLEPRSENQFLIKFHRVEGDWDDRILLHERKLYDGKEDYTLKDQNYVSVVMRRGSYSVYPKGSRKELNVFFSEDESKNVDVLGIVEAFRKQR